MMDTKDRIKTLMDDMQMSQQQFADYLQTSPATLSSIFNGRTRPTIQILEAVKKKIPQINLEWLMMGIGDMYSTPPDVQPVASPADSTPTEQLINFDEEPRSVAPQQPQRQRVETTPLEQMRADMKIIDKQQRHVTEIRVYYDDQTYETFSPLKVK